jgi:hypothetical protein
LKEAIAAEVAWISTLLALQLDDVMLKNHETQKLSESSKTC